ncbi:hypothetical protein GGP41_001390 [Bipolaris sorokiniana]|uniref:NmrA-like domain-containing protein n=1 Tax=Cochliobolus sativus TaxID=45130 RepID=A0A8H5ZAI0_COCSA|nr:hypothetical protein GGP41_001390 [Bipolaris sorokiniana]
MGIVAVAGGTGQLGRTIVEEILKRGGQEVIIFSRKVDTVISTLNMTISNEPELALLTAANQSKTTKRYIPSLWGVEYTPELCAILPMSTNKLTVLGALESTSLEYTVVINGLFMDYYGQPHVKSHISPLAIVIDMANNAAAIPGSGDVPVAFTYTHDIGRMVVALLTLPKWSKESYIIGDKLTWNEVLQIAQDIKGVKFDVKYDSVETLRKGQTTELPSHTPMYPFFPKEQLQGVLAGFGLFMENGSFDLKPPKEQNLNELFPEIKLASMKEIMGAWKGK